MKKLTDRQAWLVFVLTLAVGLVIWKPWVIGLVLAVATIPTIWKAARNRPADRAQEKK